MSRPMGDDSAQLSVDFLVGFTIFLLGLIMVANMIPGLMAGLRRTTQIDYDAVAYRTGAILAEDPGEPVSPVGWELANIKDAILRFGFAVDRETPNVLSRYKIVRFNAPDLDLQYPADYRSRLIFSDYPYRFNITVRDANGFVMEVGDPRPSLELGGYGSINRVVKIKELPYAEIDLNASYMRSNFSDNKIYCVDNTSATTNQTFTVRINIPSLINSSIGPAYRYDPRAEPINITIKNFGAKLNNSGNETSPSPYTDICNASTPDEWNFTPPDNATLKKIEIKKGGIPLPAISSFNLSVLHDGSTSYINNLTPNIEIYHNDAITFVINTAGGDLPLDEGTILDIVFTFSDDPPRTLINGTYELKYGESVVVPELTQGWLEVAVW